MRISDWIQTCALPILSRLPAAARLAGRIQRQVHERAERAARRQLRNAQRTRARQLPQFLPPDGALAVLGPAPGQGFRVNAVHELTDLHPTPDDILGDVLAGLSQSPKRLPPKYFYDRSGTENGKAAGRERRGKDG